MYIYTVGNLVATSTCVAVLVLLCIALFVLFNISRWELMMPIMQIFKRTWAEIRMREHAYKANVHAGMAANAKYEMEWEEKELAQKHIDIKI